MTPGAAAGLMGDTPLGPFGFSATTPLSDISFNMSPSIFSPNGRTVQGQPSAAKSSAVEGTPFVGGVSGSRRGAATGDYQGSQDRHFHQQSSEEYSPVVSAADLSMSSSDPSPSALQVR